MARELIRRFHAGAYSPREAYVRATETPREVRALAEAVLAWALINLYRDAQSPLGNLLEGFGFRPARPSIIPRDGPYSLPLSDHVKLFVSPASVWSVAADGTGTFLASERFEPMRLPDTAQIRDGADAVKRAKRCGVPVDWVLGWNHTAAALRQLSEYEAWVQRRGMGLRRDEVRPKAARKTDVTVRDLPAALHALAEWAGDGEQAMLAWVIADAKSRGVEPELPAQYRQGPVARLLSLIRG